MLKELYDERKKNGISPLVVDGMTDINTTMDIYAEVTETKKRSNGKSIKKLKDFLGKSPKKWTHIYLQQIYTFATNTHLIMPDVAWKHKYIQSVLLQSLSNFRVNNEKIR